jgi:hypothetical protein
MTTPIDIELQSTRDTDPAVLVTFFEKAGNDRVKRSSIAARGDAGIVQIILTIVGTWAAERYLLNPFADKLQEWTEATTSLKGRQFKISVRFQRGRLASIETFRILNPMIVQNLWQTIRSASDLLVSATEEIALDRVLIVPSKSDHPLVIGYHGTRPTHLLDLQVGKITPIEAQNGRLVEDVEQIMSFL